MLAAFLALAGATLIALPVADSGKYSPQAASAAEARLGAAGEVLGAASMCKEIRRDRLRADMDKVDAMIDKGVDDNQQYYAARNILDKAIDKGKRAIGRRETTCRHAKDALTELEKELGP